MSRTALLLVIFCCTIYSYVLANLTNLEADVDKSLKSNIVGCPYRYVRLNFSIPLANDDKEIVVRPLLPTKHEISIFQKFPLSLTQANRELGVLAERAGLSSKWADEKTLRSDIPSDHIAQDRKKCLNLTALAATEKVISFYEAYKHTQRGYYVLHARNAFIHPSGSVGLSCGYFIGNEGCEAKTKPMADWHASCKKAMASQSWSWVSFFEGIQTGDKVNAMIQSCAYPESFGKPIKPVAVGRYDKVFSIASPWDYNYHHFLTDSLARLSRNIRYLRAHPEVMIHIRSHEEYDPKKATDTALHERAFSMRKKFIGLLGLNTSRIISGPVLANEVFIPRFMKCAYLLSNPAELRLLNKQMVQASNAFIGRNSTLRDMLFADFINATPVLKGEHTRTKEDILVRQQHLAIHKSRQSKDAHPPAQVEKDFKPKQIVPKSNNHRLLLQEEEEIVELEEGVQGEGVEGLADEGHRKLIDARTRRIVIFQQYTNGPSTATEWNDETAAAIVNAFAAEFKGYTIKLISSREMDKASYCLACDIIQYNHADILVAAHGSGLSNVIFMHPGAVAVEVVGSMQAVNMPVCGYYGPMAAGLGLHHYIFAYDHGKESLPASSLAHKASLFNQHIYDPLVRGEVIKA